MQKSYLLLRHNQQSGPFSLDELRRMPLQAKDLIWVIGKSAGWRYPEEIEDLQAWITNASLPVNTVTPPVATSDQSPVTQANGPQEVTDKKQFSQHIYVSLPATAVATTQPPTPTDTSSLSFEERVEKMRQRVHAVETQKDPINDPEVETKYSRSLEDIKAEYTNWMHAQKHNRKGGVNYRKVAIGALGIGVTVSIIWMASEFFSGTTSESIVSEASAPVTKNFYPTVVMPPARVGNGNAAENKKVTVTKRVNKASNRAAAAKESTLYKREASKTDSSKEHLVKAEVPDKPFNETHTTTPEEKPASVAEQLHINAEYIAGSKKSNGVEGLAVTVKNNSTQVMKVVAVDVIYFTDGMAELERKTLYFSNLQPGQVLTRNAPAHKKAEGAYAQLGLISSEEGSIFYASNK